MNCCLYLDENGLNWTDGQPVSEFVIEQSDRLLTLRIFTALHLNFNNLDATRSRAECPIIVKGITPGGDSDVRMAAHGHYDLAVQCVLKLPAVTRLYCANAVTALVYLHEVEAAIRRSRLKKAFQTAPAALLTQVADLTMPLLHDFIRSYGGNIGRVYYEATEAAALAPLLQALEELLDRPLDRVRLDNGLDLTPEQFTVQTDGPLSALYLTLAVSSPAHALRFLAAAQADCHSRVLAVSLFK